MLSCGTPEITAGDKPVKEVTFELFPKQVPLILKFYIIVIATKSVNWVLPLLRDSKCRSPIIP